MGGLQSGAAYAMDDLARACAIGTSSPIHLAGTLANLTYVFARARRPRGGLIAWIDLRLSALLLVILRGHGSLHSECEVDLKTGLVRWLFRPTSAGPAAGGNREQVRSMGYVSNRSRAMPLR
jgi:hypothetical protein